MKRVIHDKIKTLIIISNILMSAEHAKPVDALQLVDLQTVGFTSQVDEYLALNGVTRDEVVAEMERFQDITLAVAIGNVKGTKQMQAEGVVQAGSPEHAALSAEQDAAAEGSAPESAPTETDAAASAEGSAPAADAAQA